MTPFRLALPAPAAGRIGVLDELKGVAILLVILYHAGGVLGIENVLHGETGVDIFVILSGVGLTLSTTWEKAGRFLLRRFLRIYPAYWIVLTAFLLANGYFLNRHISPVDIGLHYLGLQVLFGARYALSVNDSFWFITLIVSLYGLYVPLRRFTGRPDVLLFFGALVSLTSALLCFYGRQFVAFDHFSLRIPGFIVGLVIGRLLRTGCLEISLTPALACALLLFFYVPYTQGFVYASAWAGLAVMAAYAFILRPLLGAGVRSVLKSVGDRSLEIFLIHQPLIREYNVYVLQRWFPGLGITPRTLLAGMCVALAVTWVLSVGLHGLLKKLPAPARLSASPGLA
jgi:peptidoglycan/LPS O-acetylase OafA/YrhL